MNGVGGSARGEGADQSFSHLLRRSVHLSDRLELLKKIAHDTLPLVDMGQFATAEYHRDDHLVLVLQESLGLIDLELDVVLASLGTKTDFFDLRVMDVGFVLFFLLLILKLAEVHDSADGRFLVRRDLDKIEPRLTRPGHRLVGGDDSELPPFGGDHADRGNPDLLVDAMILIDGLRLRTPTNCQAMPRDGGTVNLPLFPALTGYRQAGLPGYLPDTAAGQAPSGLIESQVGPGTDFSRIKTGKKRRDSQRVRSCAARPPQWESISIPCGDGGSQAGSVSRGRG